MSKLLSSPAAALSLFGLALSACLSSPTGTAGSVEETTAAVSELPPWRRESFNKQEKKVISDATKELASIQTHCRDRALTSPATDTSASYSLDYPLSGEYSLVLLHNGQGNRILRELCQQWVTQWQSIFSAAQTEPLNDNDHLKNMWERGSFAAGQNIFAELFDRIENIQFLITNGSKRPELLRGLIRNDQPQKLAGVFLLANVAVHYPSSGFQSPWTPGKIIENILDQAIDIWISAATITSASKEPFLPALAVSPPSLDFFSSSCDSGFHDRDRHVTSKLALFAAAIAARESALVSSSKKPTSFYYSNTTRNRASYLVSKVVGFTDPDRDGFQEMSWSDALQFLRRWQSNQVSVESLSGASAW